MEKVSFPRMCRYSNDEAGIYRDKGKGPWPVAKRMDSLTMKLGKPAIPIFFWNTRSHSGSHPNCMTIDVGAPFRNHCDRGSPSLGPWDSRPFTLADLKRKESLYWAKGKDPDFVWISTRSTSSCLFSSPLTHLRYLKIFSCNPIFQRSNLSVISRGGVQHPRQIPTSKVIPATNIWALESLDKKTTGSKTDERLTGFFLFVVDLIFFIKPFISRDIVSLANSTEVQELEPFVFRLSSILCLRENALHPSKFKLGSR
ncbi:hypothetical protein AVEN_71009-1 [Araneus ventricosus]|uniref:Uncharacterized protein n=1 Tax=Araneus ventricosus TaxID=182803 RepID=A0A4Y2G6Q2_ARAVE|nr:hypothetical protein AVEN_71009-1 [Araneus ventricosus]